MFQWEYKTEEHATCEYLVDFLNHMGEDGWEFIEKYDVCGSSGIVAICLFKRLKESIEPIKKKENISVEIKGDSYPKVINKVVKILEELKKI